MVGRETAASDRGRHYLKRVVLGEILAKLVILTVDDDPEVLRAVERDLKLRS